MNLMEDGMGRESRLTANDVDGNWDLASPLLPRDSQSLQSESDLNENEPMIVRHNGLFSSPVDILHDEDGPSGSQGGVSPLKWAYTIVASTMCMIFVGLTIGSLFFPWSDTMVRLTLDTLVPGNNGTEIGRKIDFNVPLYKDATFRSTLEIFKTSHSTLMVSLIIISTLVVPSILMLTQLGLATATSG